ncbi:hypothetical protein, partial [Bacillus coahuilensis]|uniref:hypothetical protein n=1 Tax=Bacillus coahuilensis TaxID=408580 RepID=UPI0019D3BACF
EEKRREKSAAQTERGAQRGAKKREERRADRARSTKRRKKGRRAPRGASAVQKEEQRKEKSAAQTERGAQRGEQKRKKSTSRPKCSFQRRTKKKKQYRAISPQPDNRRHPVNTQKPRQINSKKTNNPKRSSVYTPNLLKQRIKATASLSHKFHLPYK